MKRKLMLLLACLFVGIGLVTAQTQKITGVVISEEDGQPVVGASVLVKGTTQGTITDVDGNFNLSNVPSSAKTLQISYIGMQTQEVVIKPNLKVVLKSDSQKLDEVVVTAMGIKRSEKSLGYSVTSVKGDEITKARESNVLNSLSGRRCSGGRGYRRTSGDHIVHRDHHAGDLQAGGLLDFVLDAVRDAAGSGGNVQPIADSDVQLDHETSILLRDADTLFGIIGTMDQAAHSVGHITGCHCGNAVAVFGRLTHEGRKIPGGKADISQRETGSDHNRSAPLCYFSENTFRVWGRAGGPKPQTAPRNTHSIIQLRCAVVQFKLLAAGIFWLFCVLCPQICGQNCTAGLNSAFVRQGMTVRV